jgi:hypothetical protein
MVPDTVNVKLYPVCWIFRKCSIGGEGYDEFIFQKNALGGGLPSSSADFLGIIEEYGFL